LLNFKLLYNILYFYFYIMVTMNKRRSGDENIWKLIVFAITIVIAIWLVGLVSYFYTESRQQAVNTSILSSTNSTAAEIANVADACTAAVITYWAVDNLYTMTVTDAAAATACQVQLALIKWVKTPTAVGTTVTYKMN